MRRFRNILFSPLGQKGNPAALRRVSQLAEQNTGDVLLLGVVAGPSRLERMLSRPGLVDKVIEDEQAKLASTMKGWIKRGEMEATSHVEVGDPALRIIQRVIAHGHDLVVVSSDEDKEDQTTIRRLLRKCPCPVWVIRATRARTQRVLAAINPDPQEVDLNQTILKLASSMVGLHGGELHVVHAWEMYGEERMRQSAFLRVPGPELDELLQEEYLRHRKALTELLGSVPAIDEATRVHLTKGEPARVVPEIVAKNRINLLVIGTVGRAGLSGMIMGNTAESILDEVTCSVIAVKPPGFISPIQVPAS